MTSYGTEHDPSTAATTGATAEHDDHPSLTSSLTTSLSYQPHTSQDPTRLVCTCLPQKMNVTTSVLEQRPTSPNNGIDVYDCDESSQSDGHEKADTTPENLKKIDDVIEQQQKQQQQQQQSVRSSQRTTHFHNDYQATTPITTTTTMTTIHTNELDNKVYTDADRGGATVLGSGIGIGSGSGSGSSSRCYAGIGLDATTVDDSNAKYCFTKAPAPAPAPAPVPVLAPTTPSTLTTDIELLCTEKDSTFSNKSEQHKDINIGGYCDSISNSSSLTTSTTMPAAFVGPRRVGNGQRFDYADNVDSNRQSQVIFNHNEQQTSPSTSTSTATVTPTPTAMTTNDDDSLSAATPTDTTNTHTNTNTNTTNGSSKQSYAFTIDNFNDKECDPATQAAKYKQMLERFQNRHRRGASLSKLESDICGKESGSASAASTPLTGSMSGTPLSMRNGGGGGRNASNTASFESTAEGGGDSAAVTATTATTKVKLRARDPSTSRVRDASKRHSWSPRSSTHESMSQQQQQQHQQRQQLNTSRTAAAQQQNSKSGNQAARKNSNSSTSAGGGGGGGGTGSASKTKPPPLQMPKGAANLVANRTQFTPRSTAMQLALQKVDFLCAQPPLGDFKHLNIEGDNVSEAGTYTLDGDNYTEEQKDLMNIDKSARSQQQRLQQQQQQQQLQQEKLKPVRPKELNLKSGNESPPPQPELPPPPLPVIDKAAPAQGRTSNVLEVNYYHETDDQQPPQSPLSPGKYKFSSSSSTSRDLILGSHESAGAYLEKIKSRVLRNNRLTSSSSPPTIGEVDLGQKSSTEDDDMGCFTSVTTSGVLAKQSALDPRPKMTRKSGLSTSQIDSSEYVSNETKLKTPTASVYAAGGFTDHQKAEYRLNLFTNQKDTNQKFAATRSYIESPPETPTGKLSDTAGLKTAQSKNDWIQEWARNARARSLAAETQKRGQHGQSQELMTRSYTCADTGSGLDGESLTDDSIYSKQCHQTVRLNKSLAERYRLAGELDYSSDPTAISTAGSVSGSVNGGGGGVCRPPKSPSKIPSPLHSLGRARSASRTRQPLENIFSPNEEDIYLAKTAAAINNLQQSLSRKNSLKSPTHSGSPRAHSARSHAAPLYSPEECSPQHSLGSPTAFQRSPLHRQRRLAQEAYMRGGGAVHQLMTSSFNEQQLQLLTSGDYLTKQMRMRKNSFDGQMGNSPIRRSMHGHSHTARAAIDQPSPSPHDASLSPLRRSSSFSAKIAAAAASNQRGNARPQYQNIYTPPAARHNLVAYSSGSGVGVGGGHHQQASTSAANGHGHGHAIKKSASSTNFPQVYSDYADDLQYYINDEDDEEEEFYSSGEDQENLPGHHDGRHYVADDDAAMAGGGSSNAAGDTAVPLSNTRYNKALLMRIERSKQKVSGKMGSAPPSAGTAKGGGSAACPNTPELPRRGIKSAPRAIGGGVTSRQSMPRDTSLNRLATQVPSSLASAKKQLLQTAAGVPTNMKLSAATNANQPQQQRSASVQPKYLDISKYKPAQGNAFLRKNEAKSTLKTCGDVMKRSPSSSSMGLTRTDPTRASNRSVRSTTSCMTASGTSLGPSGRASSAARRDASVNKQKEAEMAMWKRRSTYDPMKAAAEDRRKKEEAKRLALLKSSGVELPCERPSRSPYRRGQL